MKFITFLNAFGALASALVFIACVYALFIGAWWHCVTAAGSFILTIMFYYVDGDESVAEYVKSMRRK